MKLSPNYREDSIQGLPLEVKRFLDAHFLAKLDNLDVGNPKKVVVVFSGGNGVGKSALSEKIKQRFQAVVLENDSIKAQIRKFNPAIGRDDLNVLTWKYSMNLYERLDTLTPNGLIVRDGIIDWYYDRILPVFEAHGYALFIICFDLSRGKRVELIKARGDKTTVTADRLIEIIPDHDTHIERFRKVYIPDVLLTDATVFDHELVLDKLGEVLGS